MGHALTQDSMTRLALLAALVGLAYFPAKYVSAALFDRTFAPRPTVSAVSSTWSHIQPSATSSTVSVRGTDHPTTTRWQMQRTVHNHAASQAPALMASNQPSDPYAAPTCHGEYVLLAVAASEAPSWSTALLVGPDTGMVVGTSDELPDGKRVGFIAWDRVWLTRSGNSCQLRLVASTVAGRTSRLSSTWRRLVKRLQGQPPTSRSMRLVPARTREGQPVVKVFGTSRSPLLEALGLRNGDSLLGIGHPQAPVSTAPALRSAWQQGLNQDHLTFFLLRRGRQITSTALTH